MKFSFEIDSDAVAATVISACVAIVLLFAFHSCTRQIEIEHSVPAMVQIKPHKEPLIGPDKIPLSELEGK